MARCGRWTGALAALCAGALASSAAQTVPPPIIDLHVHAARADGFLSGDQKRDILYNNAARFLKLSPQEIARHHGR